MESSEKHLITEILEGNKEVYAVLVRRYQKQVFNLMLRMTSSTEDAFDLTQDTFVRAYENLARFDPSSRFFPWLYTIGLNLARDFRRKKRVMDSHADKIREAGSDLYFSSNRDHADFDIEYLDYHLVQDALAALPVESREAVILRFREDMTMKDVAKVLGISISGAKMRIHRAMLKLRRILYDKQAGSPRDP